MSQPFQQQRLSPAERRAAQERARRRREALEAAQAAGGLHPTGLDPMHTAPHVEEAEAPEAPKRVRRARQKRPGLRFVLGIVLATLGYMGALSQGGPVLGHDWNYAALAAGTGVLLVGALLAWWNSLQTPRRTLGLTLGVAVLLATTFSVGTFTSIVVNGQVHPTTSDTAQAYRLAHELREDLEYVAQADQLLDAEQADARARFAEYEPTAEQLAEISKKWAKVADDPNSLPSPGFAEVAKHTANGAHWAAEAMVRKQQLIVEPDARGEADVASYRVTYAQEVLTAGPQLVAVAKLYGIVLTEEGPVE